MFIRQRIENQLIKRQRAFKKKIAACARNKEWFYSPQRGQVSPIDRQFYLALLSGHSARVLQSASYKAADGFCHMFVPLSVNVQACLCVCVCACVWVWVCVCACVWAVSTCSCVPLCVCQYAKIPVRSHLNVWRSCASHCSFCKTLKGFVLSSHCLLYNQHPSFQEAIWDMERTRSFFYSFLISQIY